MDKNKTRIKIDEDYNLNQKRTIIGAQEEHFS